MQSYILAVGIFLVHASFVESWFDFGSSSAWSEVVANDHVGSYTPPEPAPTPAPKPWHPESCKLNEMSSLFGVRPDLKCKVWAPVKFSAGPMVRMLDIKLPYMQAIDGLCKDDPTFICAHELTIEGSSVTIGEPMDALRNIQVKFYTKDEQNEVTELGSAGPLWIKRPSTEEDNLKTIKLPGNYGIDDANTEATFLYFAPESIGGENIWRMQANTVDLCWGPGNDPKSNDQKCWGYTPSTSASEFIEIRNFNAIPKIEEYKMNLATLDRKHGKETLTFEMTVPNWSCQQTLGRHDDVFRKIHFIVYEASKRRDNQGLNDKLKPVLFYKRMDACSSTSLIPQFKFVESKDKAFLGLLNQINSLENPYLYNGGEAVLKDHTAFFPQWSEGTQRFVRVAYAFCNEAASSCSEYDDLEVNVSAPKPAI